MERNKRILSDIIKSLEDDEILEIHYQGFIGKGINGLANNIAYISKDEETIVHKWENFYSTKMERYCLDYILLEDCVMITQQDVNVGRDIIQKNYTTYIPYSSITSFEVIHKI